MTVKPGQNVVDIRALKLGERDVARLLFLQSVPSLAGMRVTVADAAELLGVTRQRLWQLGKEMELPVARDGTYDLVEITQRYFRYLHKLHGEPKMSLVDIARMEAQAERELAALAAGTDPTAPQR